MSTFTSNAIMQRSSLRVGSNQVSTLHKFLATVFRMLVALIPRRSTPLPHDPIFVQKLSEGYFQELSERALIRYYSFCATFLLALFFTTLFGVYSADMNPTVPFKCTLFLAAAFILVALRLGENNRAILIALRVMIARQGIMNVSATWVFEPMIWEAAIGRIILDLSDDEQEIVFTLAEEWEGSLGELLDTTPFLVKSGS